MPQKRMLIALVVASIAGLLAIVIAVIWLKTSNPINKTQVVAATRPIAAGVALTVDDLRMIDLTREAVPLGASPKIELLSGRISKINIAPGEIILDRMLNAPGVAGGLAFAITPGMRAISLGVNEISDVAGFISPGNFVDVLLISKDESGRPSSKILLDRVLVLAIAQDRMIQDETKAKVVSAVTLEVSPTQAAILDEGRSLGNISLILRNQSDGNKGVSVIEESSKRITTTENGVEVIRGTTVRIESGLGNRQ